MLQRNFAVTYDANMFLYIDAYVREAHIPSSASVTYYALECTSAMCCAFCIVVTRFQFLYNILC